MITTAILGIISAGLGLATAIINRKRKTKPTAQQLTEKAIHAARTASATGDAPAVNAIVERDRITKSLLLPIAACLLLTGCGCSLLPISCPRTSVSEPPPDLPPATIVITQDRYQYPMTNHLGISGWFVPDAVHAEFLEATILLQYYRKELKK